MAVLVGKPAPDFTANAVLGNNEIREVCPAGWTKGKAGMKDTPGAVSACLASHEKEL
jgi:alkyl hydroperoxide reductase subunit AhpC